MAVDLSHLDYLYKANKANQPHTIKRIVIRIRPIDQPYGKGVSMAFQADDAEDGESALEKIAGFISLTMDNTHG